MKTKKTDLVKANILYAKGNFEEALNIYEMILEKNPFLAEIVKFNILRCKKKIEDKKCTIVDGNSKQIINIKNKGVTVFNKGDDVLFISHEASLTGAPIVLLKLMKWLVIEFEIKPKIIYCGKHLDLSGDFEKLGDCLHLHENYESIENTLELFLDNYNPKLVYSNTVVSGKILQAVYNFIGGNCKYICHIHEKENVLNKFRAEIELICKLSDKIITVSESTLKYLRHAGARPEKIKYIPPFIDRQSSWKREKINKIPVIWGCGTIERRKGFDLFCETISKLSNYEDIKFKAAWIGPFDEHQNPTKTLKEYNVTKLVDMVGQHPNPRSLYNSKDIFFLSSREEPFSLATIEAAEQGLPILCFDSGCAPEMEKFIRKHGCGLVTDAFNTDESTNALKLLIEHPDMNKRMGENGKKAVRKNFTADAIIPKILDFIVEDMDCNKSDNKKRKIFVVSLGPVPIEQIKIIEGGGMRSWGLATGFSSLEENFDVTLSFPRWFIDSSDLGIYNGVTVLTWSNEEELIKQTRPHDILIFSYCFGNISNRLANEALPHQTIIMDCYVPIHPEVCARSSKNLIREKNQYLLDKKIWDEVIVKADYILCASETQKNYYFGLLFGLGKITPINYSEADKLIIAPFGIDGGNVPVQTYNPLKKIGRESAFKLLWFGGVYPWFNLEGLIEAVNKIRAIYEVELIIVGAKNPFNTHPDFLRSTQRILDLSEMPDFKEFIHIAEWVPYDDRFNWYLNSDLIVTFNREGIENRFAWRTRILDYLQCVVPFATNGGDAISDKLISSGLGFKLSDNSIDDMSENLLSIIKKIKLNPPAIDMKAIEALRIRYSWKNIANNIIKESN